MYLKAQQKILEILLEKVTPLNEFGYDIYDIEFSNKFLSGDLVELSLDVILTDKNEKEMDCTLTLENIKMDNEGNLLNWDVSGSFIDFVSEFNILDNILIKLTKEESEFILKYIKK